MTDSEKPALYSLLAGVLASYGKPLPESALLKAWVINLAPYPMSAINAAFQSYLDENGQFAPTPAGIAMRCKLMDGRPGAEEAWAIALTSQDEADTVVWTAEAAEAFALCRPVLAMGDEVGARMAFKDAYTRIVAQARAERRPAQWSASLGWDITKRTAVLKRAAVAGLLAAPTVTALLPAPAAGAAPGDSKARDQLAMIIKMQKDAATAKEAARLAAVEREHHETDEFKRRTNEQVRQHLAGGAS